MTYTPMQLADAFIQTGELQDALDALQQQLDAHPDDHEARRLRIAVQARMGGDQLAQAIADLNALPAKTAADYQQLSILYERTRQPAEAIDAMQTARTLAPDDPRLSERLLRLYQDADRLDEALALVREQARTWRWLQWEADLLVQRGDARMATARYGLVLAQLAQFEGQMRPDYLRALLVRVLLARAGAYRQLDELDTAQEQYEQAQALSDDDDPTIAFNLGVLSALRGDLPAAIAQCQRAYQRAPHALRQQMHATLADERLVALRTALSDVD